MKKLLLDGDRIVGVVEANKGETGIVEYGVRSKEGVLWIYGKARLGNVSEHLDILADSFREWDK